MERRNEGNKKDGRLARWEIEIKRMEGWQDEKLKGWRVEKVEG